MFLQEDAGGENCAAWRARLSMRDECGIAWIKAGANMPVAPIIKERWFAGVSMVWFFSLTRGVSAAGSFLRSRVTDLLWGFLRILGVTLEINAASSFRQTFGCL